MNNIAETIEKIENRINYMVKLAKLKVDETTYYQFDSGSFNLLLSRSYYDGKKAVDAMLDCSGTLYVKIVAKDGRLLNKSYTSVTDAEGAEKLNEVINKYNAEFPEPKLSYVKNAGEQERVKEKCLEILVDGLEKDYYKAPAYAEKILPSLSIEDKSLLYISNYYRHIEYCITANYGRSDVEEVYKAVKKDYPNTEFNDIKCIEEISDGFKAKLEEIWAKRTDNINSIDGLKEITELSNKLGLRSPAVLLYKSWHSFWDSADPKPEEVFKLRDTLGDFITQFPLLHQRAYDYINYCDNLQNPTSFIRFTEEDVEIRIKIEKIINGIKYC